MSNKRLFDRVVVICTTAELLQDKNMCNDDTGFQCRFPETMKGESDIDVFKGEEPIYDRIGFRAETLKQSLALLGFKEDSDE